MLEENRALSCPKLSLWTPPPRQSGLKQDLWPVLIFLLHAVLAVALNANRHVTGTLRGFDQFMNLVLDNTVDDKTKSDIGMVVSCWRTSLHVCLHSLSCVALAPLLYRAQFLMCGDLLRPVIRFAIVTQGLVQCCWQLAHRHRQRNALHGREQKAQPLQGVELIVWSHQVCAVLPAPGDDVTSGVPILSAGHPGQQHRHD